MHERRPVANAAAVTTLKISTGNWFHMFDAGKTRMIELSYGEKKYDDMLSRFHLIPERNGRTDGRTDRLTDGQICYINIPRQYADAR